MKFFSDCSFLIRLVLISAIKLDLTENDFKMMQKIFMLME